MLLAPKLDGLSDTRWGQTRSQFNRAKIFAVTVFKHYYEIYLHCLTAMRKRSKRRKYELSLYRAWIPLAFSLFILSPVLGELKCLVGSYTIKNWIPCQQLPLAVEFVTPRCSMSSLPQCLNNDPTCPDYGVMPCQVMLFGNMYCLQI